MPGRHLCARNRANSGSGTGTVGTGDPGRKGGVAQGCRQQRCEKIKENKNRKESRRAVVSSGV